MKNHDCSKDFDTNGWGPWELLWTPLGPFGTSWGPLAQGPGPLGPGARAPWPRGLGDLLKKLLGCFCWDDFDHGFSTHVFRALFLLGFFQVSPSFFQDVPHVFGRFQADVLNMLVLLWALQLGARHSSKFALVRNCSLGVATRTGAFCIWKLFATQADVGVWAYMTTARLVSVHMRSLIWLARNELFSGNPFISMLVGISCVSAVLCRIVFRKQFYQHACRHLACRQFYEHSSKF